MLDKIIIVKGKLVKCDKKIKGHGVKMDKWYDEATIELSTAELVEQLCGCKILPQPQQNKQFPISACCNASVKYYTLGVPKYYRCDACGNICKLADWNKPQQEFCECWEKLEPGMSLPVEKINPPICAKCEKEIRIVGKPLHPEPKPELLSEIEIESTIRNLDISPIEEKIIIEAFSKRIAHALVGKISKEKV